VAFLLVPGRQALPAAGETEPTDGDDREPIVVAAETR
jgi:hypothetical protein